MGLHWKGDQWPTPTIEYFGISVTHAIGKHKVRKTHKPKARSQGIGITI